MVRGVNSRSYPMSILGAYLGQGWFEVLAAKLKRPSFHESLFFLLVIRYEHKCHGQGVNRPQSSRPEEEVDAAAAVLKRAELATLRLKCRLHLWPQYVEYTIKPTFMGESEGLIERYMRNKM